MTNFLLVVVFVIISFLSVFCVFICVSIFICNNCRVAMHFMLPALSSCKY